MSAVLPTKRSLLGRITRRVRIAWVSYHLFEIERYIERCKIERLRTPAAIAVDEKRAEELRAELVMLECER